MRTFKTLTLASTATVGLVAVASIVLAQSRVERPDAWRRETIESDKTRSFEGSRPIEITREAIAISFLLLEVGLMTSLGKTSTYPVEIETAESNLSSPGPHSWSPVHSAILGRSGSRCHRTSRRPTSEP